MLTRSRFLHVQVLGKADFKLLLKWRLKMQKYKEELLKQDAPEETVEAVPVAPKEPERELTEKEKDALVREELAQLRANVLAKKKREKKKVCCRGCILCVCVWAYPSGPCHQLALDMFRINPPDPRYAPI